jgi:DNA-binding NarL/FixJ family response regulator
LGDEAFAAAWAAGRRLTTEEARVEAAAVATDREPAPIPVLTDTASHSLSPRELEVLRLLVGGKSNPEIGEALFISPRTAQTHVTAILAKLGVASRTEAAAVAVRDGLV